MHKFRALALLLPAPDRHDFSSLRSQLKRVAKLERASSDSGRWQTTEFSIDSAGFADIAISASSDLTLHMIEVIR